MEDRVDDPCSNTPVCEIGRQDSNVNLGLQHEPSWWDIQDLLVLVVLLRVEIKASDPETQRQMLWRHGYLLGRAPCWAYCWTYRCCLWRRDLRLNCTMKIKVIPFLTNVNLHRLRWRWAHVYSHCNFGVVQEVLHRVEAGELVQDLRAVGDHACGGIYGVHNARNVDILDAGEVGKQPSSLLVDCLLKIEMCIIWLLNLTEKCTFTISSTKYHKDVVAGCNGALINRESER